MKTLMIAIVALISTNAMATSLVPQRPVLQLNGFYYGTQYVATVNNYGTLKVIDRDTKKVIGEKKLAVETFNIVDNYAAPLADAEVVTTHSQVVCMMMPPGAFVGNLQVSRMDDNGLYTGKLRVVLSQEGCWAPSHTSPKDEWALAAARTLKNITEVLVFENAELKKN